jgi:chromosome partitioning protein
MARVVAVGNLKGGVGKSTLAVNLACELAIPSRRVVLVDADEQGTASSWAPTGALPVTIYALPLEGERQAADWMRRIQSTDADIVVIDLPPHIGAATAAALILADLFLVPTTPSMVDLRATAKVLELLAEARAERGDKKPECLLVPSKVDRRTNVGREIEAALHELGDRVAPAIGLRSAFVDSAGAGSWVGAFAPGSTADNEIKAVAAIVRRLMK